MFGSVIYQNEYIQFIAFLISGVILAHIVKALLQGYVKKLIDFTKSNLDNKILEIISKPVYIYIILSGLALGLKTLSYFREYEQWIDNGYYVVSILLAASLVSRILGVVVDHWLSAKQNLDRTPQLIQKIIAVFVYIIALLMILAHFGVEITPMLATLGVGGLAIGLALKDTLSNIFSGLYIISDKPAQVGDFIELEGGLSGYVDDIGWRTTRIKTLPNNYVIVPNSKLAESTITNNSKPQKEMSVVVQCGVDYGSDLEKVEKVTIEVAKEVQKKVKDAVTDFEPFIRYHTFEDSNINFSIILRVKEPVAKYETTHEFIKALKARYDKEGIEISWPIRKSFKMN